MKFEARVEEFLVWRTGYFEAGKKRDLNKGWFPFTSFVIATPFNIHTSRSISSFNLSSYAMDHYLKD